MDNKIREKPYIKELKDAVKEVAGEKPHRVILFGSRARGDCRKDSDMDIAVLIPGLTRKDKKLLLEMIGEVEEKNMTALSVLVMSEEDFSLLKSRERLLARDIETEGILL